MSAVAKAVISEPMLDDADGALDQWREAAALEWRLSSESRFLHSSDESPALLKVPARASMLAFLSPLSLDCVARARAFSVQSASPVCLLVKEGPRSST